MQFAIHAARGALAAALAFAAIDAAAQALGTPALAAGENIRRETGTVTVNASPIPVVRYVWRDSGGNPRSVALVPASVTTSGYAVQMSYMVNEGGLRTVYLNADPAGDGGFGYFVSHELFRHFTDNSDGTIAAFHGEDDSPYGRNLPSTGSASSAGSQQAAHEYRLSYRRWARWRASPIRARRRSRRRPPTTSSSSSPSSSAGRSSRAPTIRSGRWITTSALPPTTSRPMCADRMA
jgi:hypothetical protein